MKTLNNKSLFSTALSLILGTACLSCVMRAQLTPVPDHFTDWTGAVNADFFNPGNWSTNIVPDGSTVAIRLPGSADIPNKNINMVYTGTGTKRVQAFSIQTGASRIYTLNLAGTEDGWLEFNPIGKGFTFNGFIGNTAGIGMDIRNPESTGGSSVRIAVNVVLNSYSRIVLDNSYSSMRVLESGLSQGVFTLKGNAEMDLSKAGLVPFITATGTHSPGTMQIGGFNTDVGSVINVGNIAIRMNDRIAAGETCVWAGLLISESTSATAIDIMGSGITIMSGMVSSKGTLRPRGSGSQYIVDGIHNGKINIQDKAFLGGNGLINGEVTVSKGGTLTPGMRDTATDRPLTINGNLILNGNLSFDLVTPREYDRLILNGDLTIAFVDAVNNPNLAIGRAATFPFLPGTYELMTVNGEIYGEFVPENVALPVSMSLASAWRWNGKTLEVSFEQLPFASNAALSGRHLTVAKRIDEIVNDGTVRDVLFDTLNRQSSIIRYRDVLDQLSPSTYQAWFPSAVIRTNSMVQSLEDRMYQDAAYKRKKGSKQMFFEAYRQEAMRDKNTDATYSKYGTIASVVGYDCAFGESFVAGGFLGYEYTDFDLDTAGGTCRVNSVTAGLKARYNKGNFQLNLAGLYGIDDYTSSRTVAMTNLGTWADAETSGARLGAATTLAYTLKFSWFEVMPSAGIQWLSWQVDGFQEHNANEANLRVYDQSETSLQGKLGIRIARSFKTKYGSIRPFFHYAYLHEFETDARMLSADLFGGRIDINAPATKSNGYRLDFGFDWNASEKLRLELRYTSEYNCAADSNVGVRAGFNYTF